MANLERLKQVVR